MLIRNFIRKSLASCLLLAVTSVSSMVALAADTQQEATASITVTGNVTVNDRPAISNSTIVSGSTITTGESTNSIATVDLGKLGRVELLSQSSLVLKFDNSGIYATVLVGKVRVMNMQGVTTTVTTKEGITVGDSAQANTFSVESECGRTMVNAEVGNATLRAEGQDRQVAAGSEVVAGSLSQTGCRPCLRPDPNKPFPTIGAGFLPVLLPIIIGTGVATVFLANRGEEVEVGPGGIVVSNLR